MPAARQASRCSGKRIGGERNNRRAAAAGFRLDRADAARRFDAVDAAHAHIHQDQVERQARTIRGEERFHRGVTARHHLRAVAELLQQRARQQRVDLVVLRDQDRQSVLAGLAEIRQFAQFVRDLREAVAVHAQAFGERSGADRLHQIAAEAARLQIGEFGARLRRDGDEPARHAASGVEQRRRWPRCRAHDRSAPRSNRAPAARPAPRLRSARLQRVRPSASAGVPATRLRHATARRS